MNFIQIAAAGFLSGFLGAMGLGGGSVLIIFLVLFLNTPQIQAQGMNLIFFIPCALTALIIHSKNKLIKWKYVLITDALGIMGIITASLFLNKIDSEYIRKIFAVFIFVIGFKEIIKTIKEYRKKQK